MQRQKKKYIKQRQEKKRKSATKKCKANRDVKQWQKKIEPDQKNVK